MQIDRIYLEPLFAGKVNKKAGRWHLSAPASSDLPANLLCHKHETPRWSAGLCRRSKRGLPVEGAPTSADLRRIASDFCGGRSYAVNATQIYITMGDCLRQKNAVSSALSDLRSHLW